MSFLANNLRSTTLFRQIFYDGIYFHKTKIEGPVSHLIIRNISNSTPKKGNFLKMGLAGLTMGALVGTGYSIHFRNKPRQHILNEHTFIPTVSDIPDIIPSQKVRYTNDKSGLKLTLYQYKTCPFCCKVRAFLDYYGISYNVIEVDPVLRQSIKWSAYPKVPLLVVNIGDEYQPLTDSTMIISALATYLRDTKKEIVDIVKCYPFITYNDEEGKKKTEIMNKYFLMLSEQNKQNTESKEISEERKWRKWVDDVLVHTISPNVYRTKDEALQAFQWFSEIGEWNKNFPAWERNLMVYVGAVAMWGISKRLKKRHNLKDDVRQSLYDECNIWIKNVHSKGSKFMGGDHPNLADLSAYGTLSSFEGCIAFQDLLEHTKIKKWYFDMKNATLNNEGSSFI